MGGAHLVAPAALGLLGAADDRAQGSALSSAVHLQLRSRHGRRRGRRHGLQVDVLGQVGILRRPLLEVEAAHPVVPGALGLLVAPRNGAALPVAVSVGHGGGGALVFAGSHRTS